MANSIPFAEVWRGEFLECVHEGDAVVCDEKGEIVHAWGDPEKVILPRSSCKIIQALPLVETGAADALGLKSDYLALACASHQAASIHTDRVRLWLDELGMTDDDFRCGPQPPNDRAANEGLIKENSHPCQYHNNCSGKHSGFLTVSRHLRAGPEYTEVGHPLQVRVLEAFEDLTGETSRGFGIDGCSAPNFSTTLHGLARAMAFFASVQDRVGARAQAADRLLRSILEFPEMVAGEGQACTELMRAMGGKVAVKGGAEGMYTAIIPKLGLGVALKIRDGAERGSECAIAAILVQLGVLDANHPAAMRRMMFEQRNRAGLVTGMLRPADGFPI